MDFLWIWMMWKSSSTNSMGKTTESIQVFRGFFIYSAAVNATVIQGLVFGNPCGY